MAILVKYDLLVIGAGGTGTYFLKEVSRQISCSIEIKKRLRNLMIIDGDTVEEKNLERQCFAPEDIGRNKAVCMANILNDAFGLNWVSYATYLEKKEQLQELLPTHKDKRVATAYDPVILPVIIGCVDNHACRILCEQFFNEAHSCIYFDSANEFSNGETVFAYKMGGKLIGPPRSSFFPEIKDGDLRSVTEMSCEELNHVVPQHIYTNMFAGLNLCSGFNNLMHESMHPGVAFFNPQRFTMEFVPYAG